MAQGKGEADPVTPSSTLPPRDGSLGGVLVLLEFEGQRWECGDAQAPRCPRGTCMREGRAAQGEGSRGSPVSLGEDCAVPKAGERATPEGERAWSLFRLGGGG